MKTIKRLLFLVLLVIAVTGIYYWIKYSSNNIESKTMNEEARKNAGGAFIKLSGGITHYQSAGPDTGKVVILVHGFSVPYYIWDATFDSLSHNGFHVIRYDEFGRGYSDRPDVVYEHAFYRTQITDLITALKLKTPVNIAGLSFGGPVVTDFVVHHPDLVDKVILVDPAYKTTTLEESELVANYKLALNHEEQANGQLMDVKYPEKFPGWVDKYKVQMQYKGFRHALISTEQHFFGDILITNYQKLGTLQKKILLVWGKEDSTVPFQMSDSLKRIVPVELFPVDDARHLPHLEKPALVNEKIISFLRE